MKKLVCIITVLLCLGTCFMSCLAAPDLYFTLRAEQQPKENVKLNVNISKDAALYTTEFYINYNTDEVKFLESKSAVGENAAELNPVFSATEISKGRIKVSYTATSPLDDAGALCVLEFRAKADTIAYFNMEAEHAETFDGEHIRSLSMHCTATSTQVQKQAHISTGAVVAVIAAAAAAVIAVVIIKKKKSK